MAAFGYQQWKPADEIVGVDKTTFIPICFGIEYPAVFGNIAFYPGGGMSYNLMKTTGPKYDESDSKIGAWFGGNFYYMFNPRMGCGAGATFNMIFTDVVKTNWIHIPFGIKYWFM